MADNKQNKEAAKANEEGRMSTDEKKVETSPTANEFTEQARGNLQGDTTSSRGESNVSGFHGRDGGLDAEQSREASGHNPAPEESVVENEAAKEAMQQEEEERKSEEDGSKKETKKL